MDEADQASCRPDFAVILYPGGVVPRGGSELVPAVRVTKETPPTFLMQTSDDNVGVENTVLLYLALKKAGACSLLFGNGVRAGDAELEGWLPPRVLRDLAKKRKT